MHLCIPHGLGGMEAGPAMCRAGAGAAARAGAQARIGQPQRAASPPVQGRLAGFVDQPGGPGSDCKKNGIAASAERSGIAGSGHFGIVPSGRPYPAGRPRARRVRQGAVARRPEAGP